MSVVNNGRHGSSNVVWLNQPPRVPDVHRTYDVVCRDQCSCKDLPEVVWSNLKAHHYRNDLTRPGVHDIVTTNVGIQGEYL